MDVGSGRPGHCHARDRLEFSDKSGPSRGPPPHPPRLGTRDSKPLFADSPSSGRGTWATRILATLPPPLTCGGDRGTGESWGWGVGESVRPGLSLGLLLPPRWRRGPVACPRDGWLSLCARKPEPKLFQRPLGAGPALRPSAPPPPAPRFLRAPCPALPGPPPYFLRAPRTPTSPSAQVPYPSPPPAPPPCPSVLTSLSPGRGGGGHLPAPVPTSPGPHLLAPRPSLPLLWPFTPFLLLFPPVQSPSSVLLGPSWSQAPTPGRPPDPTPLQPAPGKGLG